MYAEFYKLYCVQLWFIRSEYNQMQYLVIDSLAILNTNRIIIKIRNWKYHNSSYLIQSILTWYIPPCVIQSFYIPEKDQDHTIKRHTQFILKDCIANPRRPPPPARHQWGELNHGTQQPTRGESSIHCPTRDPPP